jgi:hypothetical protein
VSNCQKQLALFQEVIDLDYDPTKTGIKVPEIPKPDYCFKLNIEVYIK